MSNQTTKKNIHDGHRERVRENVLKNGFEQLEDHRLLELLLFYSIPRGDTNELAHRLLNEFGSFTGIIKASPKKLKRVLGVGDNTAIQLSAIGELCIRASKEKARKHASFNNEQQLKELAESYYFNETNERFLVLCFDSGMRFIAAEFIAEGDSISTEIDIKKLFGAIIENDAEFVVIVHNHPDGTSEPSGADISATGNISTAVKKIGCNLFDHIIIGRDSILSMKLETNYYEFFK